MGIIRTNVAGVMFRNDDGSLRQGILAHMSKGRKLRFRDAATEDHPEAVAVFNVQGEQLGFLHSDIAHYVREKAVPPTKIKGEVISIGKARRDGGATALGCIIDISHNAFVDYEVGYTPLDYSGSKDWDAIRAYVGKSLSENVTAADVDAYEKRRSNPSPATFEAPRPDPYRNVGNPRQDRPASGSFRKESQALGKSITSIIWFVLIVVIAIIYFANR